MRLAVCEIKAYRSSADSAPSKSAARNENPHFSCCTIAKCALKTLLLENKNSCIAHNLKTQQIKDNCKNYKLVVFRKIFNVKKLSCASSIDHISTIRLKYRLANKEFAEW